MRNVNSGDQQNDAFNDLLNKFDAIDANSQNAKEQWQALIDETVSRPVNFRQRQAIIARCENSIKGVYGNTKQGVVFKGA